MLFAPKTSNSSTHFLLQIGRKLEAELQGAKCIFAFQTLPAIDWFELFVIRLRKFN